MTQIFVFGDSISYGAWDCEGGWVARLRKYLDKKVIDSNYEEYHIIYNLGVGGDTTKYVLERLKNETEQRLDQTEEKVFIFAIGVNDCLYIKSKKELFVKEKDFETNLKKLIKITRNYSSKIIFLGLTPIEESKVSPLPWDLDKFCNNKNRENYDSIVKKVAKENKLLFIDIGEEFSKLDYKALLADGVHPNSKGHERIFEVVKDHLIRYKIF